MQDIIIENTLLILLLPLWIFLIIMCGRFFSVYVNKKIIYFLTLLSSFLGAVFCCFAAYKIKEPLEWIVPFIQINNFSINYGLQIDKLSLIIAFLLFSISFAVQLFSISYMKDNKKNYRFFSLLNLFNFAMAFMLFSPNLFQFYVFWELVGVVSYLLIGFDYKNIMKSEASKRVFLMNRIGDTALIAGIIITSCYMFSFVENKTFTTLSFMDFNVISTFLMAYTTDYAYYIICGLFIIAAAVKSAQFPFYTWLQDAMEAKLPVSALLHSSTMVIAGVYLTMRMMPFYTLYSGLTSAILWLGLITALVCSVLASAEIHPKKVLAYSTSANIGLMFIGLGTANIKFALLFLIAHAFIKSALFILLPNSESMSRTNFILIIIAGLSLAGLTFSGTGTKELLFNSISSIPAVSLLYMFVCFITGFYITRLIILIYEGISLKNTVNYIELASFLILLFGNIILYIMLFGSYNLAEPYFAAAGGTALALLLAKHNILKKLNKIPKITDKLYNRIIPNLYSKTSSALDFVDSKVFADYKYLLFTAKNFVKFTNWVETNIMNKSVSFVSYISKEFSKRGMQLQSGNIQTYNSYAFIIITIIIALVILCYAFLDKIISCA